MWRKEAGVYDPDEARGKISLLLVDLENCCRAEGFQFRLIGSLGFFGLTEREPRIFRRRFPDGSVEVVDIDYVLGLPAGVDLERVKRICDKLWQTGYDGKYRVEVSPVNLPKAIANDPSRVMDFRWRLGESMDCYGRLGKWRATFPPESLRERIVNVYGIEVPTLPPVEFFALRVCGWENPLRAIKDLVCLRTMMRCYPDDDFSTTERFLQGLPKMVLRRLGGSVT